LPAVFIEYAEKLEPVDPITPADGSEYVEGLEPAGSIKPAGGCPYANLDPAGEPATESPTELIRPANQATPEPTSAEMAEHADAVKDSEFPF
jgi:hypothetical protein